MADLVPGRVTALMTCLNGEPFVEEAVDSLLGQSREADEVVLFDNGSADGTRTVFERAAKHHPQVRLHSVNEPLPAAASMARGLSLCRTEFVAFFHADDISRRDRLEIQMDAVSDGTGVIGSFLEEVDEHLNPLRIVEYPEESEDIHEELFNRNVVALPAALVRLSAVRSVGGMRPEASYATDYDLWLRMAEAGFRFTTVQQALVKYRRHPNQGSAQSDVQLLWCKFDALLASAFRMRLGCDPFASDPRLWGSTPIEMLEALVPDQQQQLSPLTSRLNGSALSWEEHRAIRDAALAVLTEARLSGAALRDAPRLHAPPPACSSPDESAGQK